jgi:Putative DNA-binding domain
MEFLSPEATTIVAQKIRGTSSVLVRIALINMEAGWSLNTLVIEVFPQPLQEPYPSYCYNYGRYAFCSGEVLGVEASSWILHQQGTFHGLSFQVPELPEQTTQIGKYPSHIPASEFSTPVPWPYTRFEVSIMSVNYSLQLDQIFLISEGCPFFPNFQTALFTLLYYGHVSEWDQAQNRSQQGRIIVRQASVEAWIEHVHFLPSSLSVQIEGSQFRNTFLQVQAPPYPPFEWAVENSGNVDCPLPERIPERVWIMLARDHVWLDYLALDQRWSPFTSKHTNMSIEQSNMNIEQPDMATQIQALIAGGEGQTVEFKQDTPDDKEQMLKTIAALANDQGGVVILGVKDKTGELMGLKEDAGRKQDAIRNMIRTTMVPEIDVRFEKCEIEHRIILAIYVDKGHSSPYGLNPTKPAYYVRRGATTCGYEQACREKEESLELYSFGTLTIRTFPPLLHSDICFHIIALVLLMESKQKHLCPLIRGESCVLYASAAEALCVCVRHEG